jgi:predicted O-linked N-acetylglucosamine transferase (SPINDLY family)
MAAKTRLHAAADLLRQGRLTEARTRLLKELRLEPQSAAALELLGVVTFEMGRHEEAIGHLGRAAQMLPSSPGPRLNLGKALLEAGRLDEAAKVLEEAVRRWPDIAEGRMSCGNARLLQGRLASAAEEYQAAIKLAPKSAAPYVNLARVLYSLNDFEGVCGVADRLLAIERISAPGWLYQTMGRQRLCLWEDHEAQRARAADLVRRGHAVFGMALAGMMLWDDADLHGRCAELTKGLHASGAETFSPPRFRVRSNGRIRVAYVSADYRRHPMAGLTAPLVEGHDRDRFEIVGISLGQDDGSPERHRFAKTFDRFIDVHASSTDAIVRGMREMELDVAVDLMGYTAECRPRIFIDRVAPVQVNYLGFPGTTAIAAMDYILVDPFVADGGLRQSATEKLAILPGCYQSNDALVQLPDPPSRSACGLPEDAFVFCSFNQARKLTPEVFDQWMRILRRVEGSVLWLLKPADTVAAALRSEAERRGVAPERIVLADRVPNDVHIARNGVADLHLDTFPYNAHTTASDALRAGCPILTRAGISFPARVCGSLLTTIGVPELITHSAEEYEALAVRLAHDKALLSGLRRRIEEGRARSPLFDPARFCRNIERAYEAMVGLSRAGKPPEEIDVRTLESVS